MPSVPEFRIPYIEHLKPAIYSLGAPVINDVVRLGLTGKYPLARLAITVEEGLLAIKREDKDHLLQVAVPGPVRRPGKHPRPLAVFKRPVPILNMHRTKDGLWRPGGDRLKVVQPEGLRIFLTTVVDYALEDQAEGKFKPLPVDL